jgi:hypothetical protein
MRCMRCKRLLRFAAKAVDTRGEPLNVGPTCARIMGLLEPKSRARKIITPTQTTRDADQLELALEA